MGATQKLLRFGVFELNLDTEELRKSGTLVKLPPQPFKLLAMLAAHAGQVVTREEIQAQLWSEGTHVDFEHGVNKCIKQIRGVLGDNADKPVYIETLPRHGYRFLAPVVSKTIAAPGPKVVESKSGEWSRMKALISGSRAMPAPIAGAAAPGYALASPVTDPAPAAEAEPANQPEFAEPIEPPRPRIWRRRSVQVAIIVVVLAAVLSILYPHLHVVSIKYADLMRLKPAELTEKDTIVVADFDNKTGDTAFDDTLKQALSIDLEQSPFLNVLSDMKVASTLTMMKRASNERLTQEVTHEVCLRTNSKAMLTPSIAELGSQYVIGIKAFDCNSGDTLAEVQKEAAGKKDVLKALDSAATSLRSKLGESLRSVQEYSTPLAETTTPSLEALQAYSMGRKIENLKGAAAALPYFKRAVELDPTFAIAYNSLAGGYNDLGEHELASENAHKAYELREKVSEGERLAIEGFYYLFTTGELDKAAQSYTLWVQLRPQNTAAYSNLGFIYGSLGEWPKSLAATQEAVRLEPKDAINYANLVGTYTALNQLDEALAAYRQAEQRQLQGEFLLQSGYSLAFLMHDSKRMRQLAAEAVGKPGVEDVVVASQADTEGWYGRFAQARELTRRSMDEALRDDAKESAAMHQAAAALREVAGGYLDDARSDAHGALKLAPNRDVRAMTALALAQAGDIREAEKLASDLDSSFPLDTLVQKYWLPTIRASMALNRKDAKRALELLKVTSPIELGEPVSVNVDLCPPYVRGQAYLMLNDGTAAVAEFQKLIDHYGLVGNFPWGALARLGMARAYAVQVAGDPTAREKTSAAYLDFLTLWKDADPGNPVYQQAKTEYAKLQ